MEERKSGDGIRTKEVNFNMKKKIICLVIWIILSILYIWNSGDSGRSSGGMINSAIEQYATPKWQEHSEDDWFDKKTYMEYYSNLDSDFKFKGIIDSLITVIYVSSTLGCYHIAFRKK